MLDEVQIREIAELAAKADEHIVRVYSGRVETIWFGLERISCLAELVMVVSV
ncbi:hypothetical protein [Profundibacter sp.]